MKGDDGSKRSRSDVICKHLILALYTFCLPSWCVFIVAMTAFAASSSALTDMWEISRLACSFIISTDADSRCNNSKVVMWFLL